MKRKMGISLLIIILMVVSTFTITTARTQGGSSSSLVVNKTVWNGESWSHEICDVVKGDIVKFNITVTFHNYGPCPNDYVYDIVAEDCLPNGLAYKDTISPRQPDKIINNKIIWNFTDDEIKLYNNNDLFIVFETVATAYGEQRNEVYVNATEFCCGEKLNAYDSATVLVEPRLDVEKKVWDSDAKAWVDELSWIIKGEKVRFQIAITYHGTDLMKCMTVDDYLGYCPYGCLDYADNVKFIYPSAQFDDPEITVSENLKYVKFDWTKSRFNLYNGESIVIEFDSNVTKYCDECSVTNHAYVDIWSCECCTHLYGYDYATVYCKPHPPVFNKKVYNGEVYADNANVYVNDTVRFKIELTYYGNENLTDIKIVDELPCVLKYAGNEKVRIFHSDIQAVENLEINSTVSTDKKTIWWNLTNELSDRDTLSIEFDALVTGITGDCDCGDCGINTASYTGNDYSGSDTAQISSTHKPPAPPVTLSIKIKPFSIGKIIVKICNTGETDANNVEWNITVKAKRRGFTVEGSFETIKNGNCVTISTGKRSIKRIFGRVEVTVTAIVPGYEPFKEEFGGLVLGRIFMDRTVRAL